MTQQYDTAQYITQVPEKTQVAKKETGGQKRQVAKNGNIPVLLGDRTFRCKLA